MKRFLFAAILVLASASHAVAEPRFEVLRLESRGTGDLFGVIDRTGRSLTAEESRVQDELRRFYRDGELEYARNYSSGRLREVARNTGLLEILHSNNDTSGCTATAITDRLLLTNSHCIPLEGPTRAVRARFFLGYETDDRAALTGRTGVTVELPAVERNDDLDFSLLRLSSQIPDYQPLRITAVRDPGIEEQLFLLGFPGGHPLSVPRRNCRTTDTPVLGDTLFHSCRTYAGNSGSLIFGDDWSLVGLHHAGIYDDTTGEKTGLSHGIRMGAILADSSVLREVFASLPNPSVAAPMAASIVSPVSSSIPDWTRPSYVVLQGHEGSIQAVAVSPDGRLVVTASGDGSARVWEATTGRHITTLHGHSDSIVDADFSPDARRIATVGSDATARIWEAESGQPIVALGEGGGGTPVGQIIFLGDGTRVVTLGRGHDAHIWDVPSGRAIHTLSEHDGSIVSIAVSPEGRRVVTGSSDNTARIWDAETGRTIVTLRGHASWVQDVAFSTDGRRVVTAGDEGENTARVWDAETGRTIAILRGHEERVYSAAFSPNGRRVATGSGDFTARLWDAETGQELAVLHHDSFTPGLAFSPDGRWLVTGSADNTARVWDAETGLALATLGGHEGWVYSVAFSPDGRRIVTGSNDRTARIWTAP